MEIREKDAYTICFPSPKEDKEALQMSHGETGEERHLYIPEPFYSAQNVALFTIILILFLPLEEKSRSL